MNADVVKQYGELRADMARMLAELGREEFIKEIASVCSRESPLEPPIVNYFAEALANLDRQSRQGHVDSALAIQDLHELHQIFAVLVAGLYFLTESGVISTSLGVNRPGERFQESRSTGFWSHLIEESTARFGHVYTVAERMLCDEF
jgi:hypothetical protein